MSKPSGWTWFHDDGTWHFAYQAPDADFTVVIKAGNLPFLCHSGTILAEALTLLQQELSIFRYFTEASWLGLSPTAENGQWVGEGP